MAPTNDGPYLATAVLCERVLEEKDGVISAIRIIDRVIQTASGSTIPENMPPFLLNMNALLSFKSGNVRGKHTIKLAPSTPSGKTMPELSYPILLEGEDRGANLIVQLSIQIEEEGIYWFNIFLDDHLVTKMPLRVVYQRISLGTSMEREKP
ncbi:hypothetical protein HY230_00395 [Candidatus Acetothermia bacterium]|nr:hypothetical protein [Candidatus Acetothermia bacterium]MBI3658920.1 hypothetical protein [Candidatus Acetothermia bacterium]